MTASGSYQFEALEGKASEARFLAERAEMRLEGFLPLLKRHGFPESGRALEIGCGHGIRTRLMAEYFPAVRVTGLDRSPELLALAQTGAVPRNLEFREGDLYALPYKDNSLDFIYARLVFMHLSNSEAALEEMKRVLRPGGRALIEDADRDCMFFEPAPPTLALLWRQVQEGQRRAGGDPNVGRKLAANFRAGGWAEVHHEPQVIQGGGKEIAFLARTLLPGLAHYLHPEQRAAAGLAIADLESLARSPAATFLHLWFTASAAKP